MTDEITVTKAELANDLVSLVKTNKDLIDKIGVMQAKIDTLAQSESNTRESYALIDDVEQLIMQVFSAAVDAGAEQDKLMELLDEKA